jgi:formylglycine-generating enzyme required for sulfatase activity
MRAYKSLRLLGMIAILLMLISSSIYAQRGFRSYKVKITGTDIQLKMVPIKDGNFNMGSTYSAVNSGEDERPIHHVELDAFWMAEHETTWELYQLFLDRSVDSLRREGEKNPMLIVNVDQIPRPDTISMDSIDIHGKAHPATNMTQDEASAFCEWLSAMTGHYYRLPTEAEWEYACRAHRESEYHFDKTESIDVFAWHRFTSNGSAHMVKGKKPNRWKLYDMLGNVAEWTIDDYATRGYDDHNTKNPKILLEADAPAVIRGGSWKKHPSALRCGAREAMDPRWEEYDQPQERERHSESVGFRVVRPYLMPVTEQERVSFWSHRSPEQ